jgi:predicted GIY-YIG superfamily endonuclease
VIALEPRLASLEEQVQQYRSQRFAEFCANTVWYGYAGEIGIRPQLVKLVGWERRSDASAPGLLKSSAAYEAAYKYLWDSVPVCSHDGDCAGPLVRIEDSPTSVYLCFDDEGCLLYVGITNGGARRGYQHASTKTWWQEVATQRWEHFGSRDEALEREAELIHLHFPPFNLQVPKRPKGMRKR